MPLHEFPEYIYRFLPRKTGAGMTSFSGGWAGTEGGISINYFRQTNPYSDRRTEAKKYSTPPGP